MTLTGGVINTALRIIKSKPTDDNIVRDRVDSRICSLDSRRRRCNMIGFLLSVVA